MSDTISHQLAEFVVSCRNKPLPKAVVDRTKLYILDTLGAMVAGADEASSHVVANVVSTLGGRESCTVVGFGFRASATGAALINGTVGHAVEIDDDHRTSALHPGVAVVPAALAMAELCGASGKTFLRGVVAGYEVITRVGNAFSGLQDSSGFHSTGTCGVFGATAAAGSILGLSIGQLTAALGIAGSQSAGLQEWKSNGSWTKRLHAGRAAESGVFSALLAAQDYTGPETVFEGHNGFLRAFSRGGLRDVESITRNLGDEYVGARTAFKPYACCRFSHPLIDAVLRLCQAHEISADDVDQCNVRIYRSGYEALFEPSSRRYRPATKVDAQFSAPYICALSILYGPPLPAHFEQELFSDPTVLKLADRIKGIPDAEYQKQFPERYPTQVTICLKDGRKISAFEDIGSGDPAKQAYVSDPGCFQNEIEQKFRELLANSPTFEDRTSLLIQMIDQLDTLKHISELTSHLTEH